ncbi:MAG: adenylate/guanylate cyclase domain-containing protein [Pseudomonadota bacterium]
MLADDSSIAQGQRRQPDVAVIIDWLIEQGLSRTDFEQLVEGFCTRLQAIDVPVWRAFVSAETLHPRIVGTSHAWRADRGISSDVHVFRPDPPPAYLRSPFKHMLDSDLREMRLRLDNGDQIAFPLLEELKAEGATDYLAQRTWLGPEGSNDRRTGVISSWTTTRQGGFSERDVSILRALMPVVALALQGRLGHEISVNLLDTYVGPEAGQRILGGGIRRGMLEVISAVIFVADLRGFTAMADRSGRDTLIEMLNAYFDCLVPVIVDHGGQVLKFLGDGLLATFPLEGRQADAVCDAALDATSEVLRCVDALKLERLAAEQPVMDLDIVLHLGDVFYGNVGSADRLDFTVIGPAVNEASRIETLCAQHERHLLISETFARAASRSADRLISIGRYGLRGVRGAQSIYTLDGH